MFMTSENIKDCIDKIQIRDMEGYERIPQRILVNGGEHFLKPLIHLSKLIYMDMEIPGQWLKIENVFFMFVGYFSGLYCSITLLHVYQCKPASLMNTQHLCIM